MSSKVRQRRGKKASGNQAVTEANQKASDGSAQEKQRQQDERTLSQIFWEHPLIVVLPFVLIPYLLYNAYLYVVLQRPELASPLYSLRPALKVSEPRQVLIVGTMSSGTTQVAHELHSNFALEVQHEVSDSTTYFCRDGTVSWFHGIRFLPPPEEEPVLRMAKLCVNFTNNMGFHPRMYAAQPCSSWKPWSSCWMKSCFQLLRNEWGCSRRQDCETPFAVTLLQVRHPMHTMESLAAKFCTANSTTVHPSFETFVGALFSVQNLNSCLEWVATYVLEYNEAMLLAHQQGTIDHWYRVEETSPCQVVALAGFLNNSNLLYSPNRDKVTLKCRDEQLQQPMVSTQYHVNKQVNLTLSDFPKGYVERIQNLVRTLGYA